MEIKKFKGDYKELIAWQKSRQLVKKIYDLTQGFPACEQYGLTSQIRRAAVSIPANVAEGHARSSNKEFAQFVSVSYASATELETLIFLACDIGYLPEDTMLSTNTDIQELLRILGTLRSKLRKETA